METVRIEVIRHGLKEDIKAIVKTILLYKKIVQEDFQLLLLLYILRDFYDIQEKL